jgi:ATP-binding cassette subfamily F protein 3
VAGEEQETTTAVNAEEKELEKKARLDEWEELKEKRRIRKRFEKLEKVIYETEKKLEEIDIMLDDEIVQTDWERLNELQESRAELRKKLDSLMREYDRFELE